jgi:hypothetical protein
MSFAYRMPEHTLSQTSGRIFGMGAGKDYGPGEIDLPRGWGEIWSSVLSRMLVEDTVLDTHDFHSETFVSI